MAVKYPALEVEQSPGVWRAGQRDFLIMRGIIP